MTRRGLLLLVWVALIAACDRAEDTFLEPAPVAVVQPGFDGPAHDLDAEWARVARTEVPGFAGYYRSDSGEYIVAVSQGEHAGRAREFVQSILSSVGDGQRPVRTRLVDYSFDELKVWKDAVTDLLDGEDIYWLDIDEVENRLVFGVRAIGIRDAIMREVTGRGVPAAAVDVMEAPKPVERVTVQNYSRPVQGGYQIQHTKNGLTYACTLGFNYVQDANAGFVTASHCSTTKFGSDGTVQYQNVIGASNRIGTEYFDPSSGRQSDAALYRYDSAVQRDWGHLARTVGPAMNQRGSLSIDPAYPRFRITSKAPNHVQTVGELVNKVGRTSGWTQGQVTRTCVTLASMACQWEALVWSEGGDSGSPMFRQQGASEPAASQVALWGILWGGPPGDWTTTWYSPISGVEADLGALSVTCDPSEVECYPHVYAILSGPMTIKKEGYHTWTAHAYHGDGSYTYNWQLRPVGSSSWQNIGTAPSITRYISAWEPDFDLRLTVTSAGKSISRESRVTLIIFPM